MDMDVFPFAGSSSSFARGLLTSAKRDELCMDLAVPDHHDHACKLLYFCWTRDSWTSLCLQDTRGVIRRNNKKIMNVKSKGTEWAYHIKVPSWINSYVLGRVVPALRCYLKAFF